MQIQQKRYIVNWSVVVVADHLCYVKRCNAAFTPDDTM